MSRSRSPAKIFTWFLLFFFAFLFVVTWHYAPRARLVPLVFLSLGLILIPLQLWLSRHETERSGDKEEREEDVVVDVEIIAPFDQEMKVLVWYILLLVGLWALGFLVATPIFLFIFLRGWAKERWLLSVNISVIFTLLMYLVVEMGFRIILYRGWIFS